MKKDKNFNLKKIINILLIVFPLILIGSLPFLFNEKIVIEHITPEGTIVGEVFQEYEGQSTLSVTGIGFEPGDTIYINNEKQATTYGNSTWLTCIVDQKLYQEVSQLEVRVKREINNYEIGKSNKKIFTVTK